MSASVQHSDNSERDNEELNVPSDHDHEESPDETTEKLEALIVQENTKLAAVKNKAKLLKIKKTFAEQSKLDCDLGSSNTRSIQNVPKKSKHKAISSHDLREFEDLPQAVEKRFSKMGLAAFASAAEVDESTSTEDSDDECWSEHR